VQSLYDNLPHVLCGLLLVSRIGDVLSTYLLTPSLALEANPVVRKLGWRFAVLSLGACVVPYFSLPVAVPDPSQLPPGCCPVLPCRVPGC
jgi:hypothetical protein